MNWTIVTGVVAVFGASLSTWNAVSKQLEKRRRVTVKVSRGFEAYGPVLGPDSVIVTALNKGQRSVTLSGAGSLLPDGGTVIYFGQSGNTRFPHELESGKSCLISMPVQAVGEQMKKAGFSGTIKLAGYFRDALDKTYASKRFHFDVEKSMNVRD
jgi:hypothetical protein